MLALNKEFLGIQKTVESSTFLQLVKGSKSSILSGVLKITSLIQNPGKIFYFNYLTTFFTTSTVVENVFSSTWRPTF